MQWLDQHIHYERYGPKKSDDIVHNPKKRLAAMRDFCTMMADPQDTFRAIHVTGTNGKTSTSRMIASLLLANGLRAGLYTSPHLSRINERIVINGCPIDDSDLADHLFALRLIEAIDGAPDLSYFELLTAAAFRAFADAPVDVGVVEVGVGGKFDATNVINADVAVITNIGLDHANYLGPTHREVASHKAGVIKQGAIAIVRGADNAQFDQFYAQHPSSLIVLGSDIEVVEQAVAVGGQLLTVRTPYGIYDDLMLSLHGAHQAENAAMAIGAVESLIGRRLPDDVARDGLGSVTVPGRAEVVSRSPLVILDGAHNTEGACALHALLESAFSAQKRRIFVVGQLAPHEPKSFLRALGAENARLIIACAPECPRAVAPERIADAAKSLGAPSVVVANVAAAVQQAIAAADDDDVVVVTGSLYVVGEARDASVSDALRSHGREQPADEVI